MSNEIIAFLLLAPVIVFAVFQVGKDCGHDKLKEQLKDVARMSPNTTVEQFVKGKWGKYVI